VKTINLTQGMVTLVDDQDYEELSKYKWYAHKTRCAVYAVKNAPIAGGQVMIHMHRHLLQASTSQQVDHINSDGLDNRRSNLRFCTTSQNMQNQRKTHGTSRFKGVCWHKQRCRWQASIVINSTFRYLGLFDSQYDAAEAYDIEARNYFGEFARLNFSTKKEYAK